MISAASLMVAANIAYAPFGPLTGLTFGNGAVSDENPITWTTD